MFIINLIVEMFDGGGGGDGDGDGGDTHMFT
jgi:hypothetical protein